MDRLFYILSLPALPMRCNDHTSCHVVSDFGTMPTTYQMQAAIKSGSSASGSYQLACCTLYIQHIGDKLDARVAPGELFDCRPVRGCLMTIEYSCFCQHECTQT